MFRTKKNITNNEQILKKISNNLNSNESSTDEGSNQKTNIYQLKQKTSPNIVIINNKTLSTHIPSIVPVDKKNFDFKNDILIKEIIGTDDLLQENNNNTKFKSLYDLANNKSEIELKNIIPNSNSSLMSKKILKKKYFNKKDKSLDEYIKGKSIKKLRKNSLNINKLKIFDYDYNYNYNNYNTPKNEKNRIRVITLNQNEKNYNDSECKNTTSNIDKNSISNSNKKEMKNNGKIDKNSSLSKLFFKNNSNLNKNEIKKMKEKKIEKIMQLMNCNNNPSLNSNLIRQIKKDNYISILSNISNRNSKIFTLQNNLNLNFNNILNSNYKNKNYKKKLFLNLNEYKREKTDYYDNIDEDKINSYLNNIEISQKIRNRKFRSNTRDNFYRKSQNNFNELNISTDYTSSEKKNNAKSVSKKKSKLLSLDSSNLVSSSNRENKDTGFVNANNQIKEKISGNNYKRLLDNVQNRMSFLIQNLINYIEILKKDK